MELNPGYTVFTKSKCKWCDKIKELIPHARFINCDDMLKNRNQFLAQMDALTGCKHRTFPFVFYDHEFIGGYAKTRQIVDNELAFNIEF